MKIELLNDDPVYHRPYRKSLFERETIKQIVTDLERNNIVGES